MSWLFGYGRGGQQPPDLANLGLQQPPAAASGGDSPNIPNLTKAEKKAMEAYKFDSSALERAAQAARELEKSKYAGEALELSKLQEVTRQHEQLAKVKEYEAHIAQMQIEGRREEGENRRKMLQEEGENRRKLLQEETKQNQIKAQYQDQLARKRYEEQLIQQQKVNEENLRKQEESVAKQEALRLQTLQREMEIQASRDAKRIAEKYQAKAKFERENKDMIFEKIRLEAAEHRDTVLKSIQTTGDLVGLGLNFFLSHKDKLVAAAGAVSLAALGIYTAKGSIGVASKYIQAHLGKPSLVKETSRRTLSEMLRHPISTFKKRPGDSLSGIILAPQLEQRIRDIAIATKNTKRNKGVFQNLLVYGPPGTGKTMFAKKLAYHSGMDYAILAGGDFKPLGQDGVTAVHKVFDWANASRKGLVLFVDEADAFLKKRSNYVLSEELRAILGAFLYRSGDLSDKFMLVLASNAPEEFDSAINDRLDEMVEFPLPELEERERLVRLYFDKYVLQPASEGNKRFKIDKFDYGDLCTQVAQRSEGLSGREIAKLGVSWQTAVHASEDGVLTEKMVLDCVGRAIIQHKRRVLWQSVEEANKNKY